MIRFRTSFFYAAVVLCALIASRTLIAQPSASFTLNLNAKKPEFRLGDVVQITIVQANTSSHRISCAYSGGNAVNTRYSYEVSYEDGKPAGKVAQSPYVPPPDDYMQCEIDRGESNTNTICLSNVYVFDKPGKYTVQVWRRDPDTKDSEGNPVKVYSNTITITITG